MSTPSSDEPAPSSQPPVLTEALAARFAAIALRHVEREYPNNLIHTLDGPEDAQAPRALHPVFFGSFDWHSCVHGYWLLAYLLRRFPAIEPAEAIRALFNAHLTETDVAGECAYFGRPASRTFERPYGWGWLLKLAEELRRHDGRRWSDTLAPLTALIVRRFQDFLPGAHYPIRVGTHFNTAFALAMAADYGGAAGDAVLLSLLRAAAERWYGGDRDCQAWEPGADDFLSSALMEAACMRQLLPEAAFRQWFGGFLPRVAQGQPATLFVPATVGDRTDGKIAHLDGLNLSRAWCWRSLASALPPGDPARWRAERAAADHLAASLPHVEGDYMGEHWLASFATLALAAPLGEGDPGLVSASV